MITNSLTSKETQFARIMILAILIGIGLGILGDYRGREISKNQLKALKNHEILIDDYEKLIKLHTNSLYVIDKFLKQEKELVRYHNEYKEDHKRMQIMLAKIYETIQERDSSQ